MDTITAFSTGRSDLQRLWNLREHGIDVNVSVICNGDFIECHRSPLIVASPVFRFWLNANPHVLPLNIEVYEAMVILKVVYGVAFSYPRTFLPRLISLLERFQLKPPPFFMGNSTVPMTRLFAENRPERQVNYPRYEKKLIPGVRDVRSLEVFSKQPIQVLKRQNPAYCDRDEESARHLDYNYNLDCNPTNEYKLFGDDQGRLDISDIFKTQTKEKHLTGCQCCVTDKVTTSLSAESISYTRVSSELAASEDMEKSDASKMLMKLCSETIEAKSLQENMCNSNAISRDLKEVEEAIGFLDVPPNSGSLLQNYFCPIRDGPATRSDVNILHPSSLVEGILMINKPKKSMPTLKMKASNHDKKTTPFHGKANLRKSVSVHGGIIDDPISSEDKEVQDILSKDNDQIDYVFREIWDVASKGLQEIEHEIWEGVSLGGRGSLMINEDLVKKAQNNHPVKKLDSSSNHPVKKLDSSSDLKGGNVQDLYSYDRKFSVLHEQLQSLWGLQCISMPGMHSEQFMCDTKYEFMPGMYNVENYFRAL